MAFLLRLLQQPCAGDALCAASGAFCDPSRSDDSPGGVGLRPLGCDTASSGDGSHPRTEAHCAACRPGLDLGSYPGRETCDTTHSGSCDHAAPGSSTENACRARSLVEARDAAA